MTSLAPRDTTCQTPIAERCLRLSQPLVKALRNFARQIVIPLPIGPLHDLFAGGATCLMYHRIVDSPCTPPDPEVHKSDTSPLEPDVRAARWSLSRGITMTAAEFEAQIKFCSEHFACLSLDDAIIRLSEGRLPKRSVVITFDDGYRDNLTVALPILEKYRVPATIFLSPKLIDDPSLMWWIEQEQILCSAQDISLSLGGKRLHWAIPSREEKLSLFIELAQLSKQMHPNDLASLMDQLRAQTQVEASFKNLMLSWEEVRQIDLHPLITLGAHTTHHWVLSKLPEDVAREEIIASKARLEEELGHPVQLFAYPFGGAAQAGEREAHLAKEAGFTCALTTRPGHLTPERRHQLFLLPRVALEGQDSVQQGLTIIKWRLSGIPAIGTRTLHT